MIDPLKIQTPPTPCSPPKLPKPKPNKPQLPMRPNQTKLNHDIERCNQRQTKNGYYKKTVKINMTDTNPTLMPAMALFAEAGFFVSGP